ncbi:MAG: hypothetical protein LBN22_05270 [Clostridiales Family XIII bacterium]|jgi:hypothetical protein|nr:hypothetical protein [Clostridiales Family XIII bacterium]
MKYEELLELLDIEDASEFTYFENFADLVETEEEIFEEELETLLEEVDSTAFSELVHNYFEDLLNIVPDDHTEFYTLLSNIGTALAGIAVTMQEEETTDSWAEEFLKFKSWYLNDSEVYVTNSADGTEETVTISEALIRSRLEHLSDDKYEYDFSEALDYELDEYVMPISALLDEEDDFLDEDSFDDRDDY